MSEQLKLKKIFLEKDKIFEIESYKNRTFDGGDEKVLKTNQMSMVEQMTVLLKQQNSKLKTDRSFKQLKKIISDGDSTKDAAYFQTLFFLAHYTGLSDNYSSEIIQNILINLIEASTDKVLQGRILTADLNEKYLSGTYWNDQSELLRDTFNFLNTIKDDISLILAVDKDGVLSSNKVDYAVKKSNKKNTQNADLDLDIDVERFLNIISSDFSEESILNDSNVTFASSYFRSCLDLNTDRLFEEIYNIAKISAEDVVERNK